MTIRPYQPADQSTLHDMIFVLNKEDFEEIPLTDEAVSAFFKEIEVDDEIKIFLAIEADKTIGYAILYFTFCAEFGGRYAELGEIFIEKPFRSRGYGKELIDFAEKDAKQHGAKSLFLVASNSNRKAQSLYESLGFKQLPRIEYIKPL